MYRRKQMKTKMKTLKVFLTIVILLGLTACGTDEEPTAADGMTDSPISISAGVNELMTRAGYATGTLTDGVIGLTVSSTGNSTNARYNVVNSKWTYSGGWSSSTPLCWFNSRSTISYKAYMPYSENAAIGNVFSSAY